MLIGTIIIVGAILFDQLTKILIYSYFDPVHSSTGTIISLAHQGFDVIPGFLEIGYYENTGSALGSFNGAYILFFIVTVIALIIFGYLFTKVDFKKAKIYSISIALFIAGTIGNAIDRAVRGFVIDFMHFPFLDWIAAFHNNWADMWLSAALVLFAIDLIFLETKRTKKKESIHENV